MTTEPTHGSSDDIDAEFRRLMEGLEIEVPEEAQSDTEAIGGEASDSEEKPFTVEDVLAAGDDSPALAVIVTPIARHTSLAGALRLSLAGEMLDKVLPAEARTVATENGALVTASATESEAHEMAQAVSATLRGIPLVLFWRRGDKMTATRYLSGERGDDIAPVLVLGACADLVEELLLGAVKVADLGEDDALDPRSLSKLQAMKYVTLGRWQK
ncbi:hypothetical protein ACUIAC_03975 [Dermabacteraceae bacterium P13138]